MEDIGKTMLGMGILLGLAGGGLYLLGKVSGIGRLPGDLVVQHENFTCLIPVATSIVLSIVLTVALNLILRIGSK